MSSSTDNTDYTKRYRNWVFTWNNPPAEEIWQKVISKINPQYVVVGREISPTTGTLHLQGYMELKHGTMKKSLVKKFRDGRGEVPKKFLKKEREAADEANYEVWVAKAVGSGEQNYEYCTKDDDFWEQGEQKSQGERVDINEGLAAIQNGMSEYDFFLEFSSLAVRHGRAFDRFRFLHQKKELKGYRPKKVIIKLGPPGTGKTRSTMEEFPDAFILRETTTGW